MRAAAACCTSIIPVLLLRVNYQPGWKSVLWIAAAAAARAGTTPPARPGAPRSTFPSPTRTRPRVCAPRLLLLLLVAPLQRMRCMLQSPRKVVFAFDNILPHPAHAESRLVPLPRHPSRGQVARRGCAWPQEAHGPEASHPAGRHGDPQQPRRAHRCGGALFCASLHSCHPLRHRAAAECSSPECSSPVQCEELFFSPFAALVACRRSSPSRDRPLPHSQGGRRTPCGTRRKRNSSAATSRASMELSRTSGADLQPSCGCGTLVCACVLSREKNLIRALPRVSPPPLQPREAVPGEVSDEVEVLLLSGGGGALLVRRTRG